MKYSRQRELICDEVLNNMTHPTADDVYSALKPTNANLSLGTVYRNLSTLSESGEINKIPVPTGSDRYDGNKSPHHHIVCSKCGCICDIPAELLNEVECKILSLTNFNKPNFVISGICHNCK